MRITHSRVFHAVFFVLLPALLLSFGLRLLIKGQMETKTYYRLDNSSAVLAQLASAYYSDDSGQNMQFVINLDLSSRVGQFDVIYCDADGMVLSCSDVHTGCSHRGQVVSESYRQRVLEADGLHEIIYFNTLYQGPRYVSAQPVYSVRTGESIGMILVSTPTNSLESFLTWVNGAFTMVSSLVMLMAVFSMNAYARQYERPLREMAKTTLAFAHGELRARVRLEGRYPEEVEELALAINNMASSLEKSEYTRQEFVANVSHELKTPMTTISGYIDGILDGTIPPHRQKHYMQTVSDETKRLSRLVRSMLDISQLQGEGGIPEEKLNRFDMTECLGQVLISFEHKILEKDIQIEMDVPEHPMHTIANQDYISQVVYNLMDNAVKFCPQGGKLVLRIRPGTSKMFITIDNNGEPIPEKELSMLFDRFHKIDKSRTRNSDGWGLGLYIVKTIIGLHGEDISVTSESNHTAFTFTLPLYN